MNKREARLLKSRIMDILPRLRVDVYQLGNGEYTCLLNKYFHVWDEDNWNAVADAWIIHSRKRQLEIDTAA